MIRKTNRRMTLCIMLLSLLLFFIWGNSLLPGTASAALSQWVKDLIRAILGQGPTDPNSGSGLLRKLAHYSEFTALGACLSWLYGMLRGRQREQIVLSLLSGILVAGADETIQRFIPGRNGCLTDVGIDTAGVITGIVIFTIGYLIINAKQKHLEETV